MKKFCIFIDFVIVMLVIYLYAISLYPSVYCERLPLKLEKAVENGNLNYIERQFVEDASVLIHMDGQQYTYRPAYVLDKLEENLPIDCISIKYVPSENAYKIVYSEPESEEQKVMFITMAVNYVNFFQVKITGMSMRL